jgi:hypothetical protein
MNAIFQKNKSIIRSYFPSLQEKIPPLDAVGPYRCVHTPKLNIYLKKRPFHSIKNPEGEAFRLVRDLSITAGSIYIFMGIGLGYHIEAFRRLYGKRANKATIVAIERSPEAFSLLLHSRDISFLKGIHLFVGESSEDVKSFFENLNPLAFKGYRIVKLRGAWSLFSDFYSDLESYFRSSLSGRLSDVLTRYVFETLWMKNIVRNIPMLTGRRSINSLKGALFHKPALVIGAGPSLLAQLDTIKEISRKLYIIAVDTSLQPLLVSGIVPDFVVTLDAQCYSLHDFHYIFTRNIEPENMILIADMVAYPGILENWRGRLYFSRTAVPVSANGLRWYEGHPLLQRLEKYYPTMDHLECGGSVATTAVELAMYLGADPVIITGLDLSYTDYKTHANSSPQYLTVYQSSNRFLTMQTSMTRMIRSRKLRSAQGIKEKQVLSDFVFLNYLQWFSEKKEYTDRLINATRRGVCIDNVRHMNLHNVVHDTHYHCRKTPVREISLESLSRTTSLKFLTDLKKDISQSREALREAIDVPASLDVYFQKYRFLKEIVLEAQSIYRTKHSSYAHITAFLNMLEKQIDISLRKTKKRAEV